MLKRCIFQTKTFLIGKIDKENAKIINSIMSIQNKYMALEIILFRELPSS